MQSSLCSSQSRKKQADNRTVALLSNPSEDLARKHRGRPAYGSQMARQMTLFLRWTTQMIVRSSKLSSATNLFRSSTPPIPRVAARLILKRVSYAYKTITRANRALAASLKLSLRIDGDGLLSLQFMLPPSRPNDEAHAFIEFKVCLVITTTPKSHAHEPRI